MESIDGIALSPCAQSVRAAGVPRAVLLHHGDDGPDGREPLPRRGDTRPYFARAPSYGCGSQPYDPVPHFARAPSYGCGSQPYDPAGVSLSLCAVRRRRRRRREEEEEDDEGSALSRHALALSLSRLIAKLRFQYTRDLVGMDKFMSIRTKAEYREWLVRASAAARPTNTAAGPRVCVALRGVLAGRGFREIEDGMAAQRDRLRAARARHQLALMRPLVGVSMPLVCPPPLPLSFPLISSLQLLLCSALLSLRHAAPLTGSDRTGVLAVLRPRKHLVPPATHGPGRGDHRAGSSPLPKHILNGGQGAQEASRTWWRRDLVMNVSLPTFLRHASPLFSTSPAPRSNFADGVPVGKTRQSALLF